MSVPDEPPRQFIARRKVAPRVAQDEEGKTKSREAFVLRIVSRETEIILELSGELDMASRSLLRNEVDAALDSEVRRVILDLSELKFIDSSGIKTLYNAWERSREVPNRLTIRGAQGLVKKVLTFAGLDSVILGDS